MNKWRWIGGAIGAVIVAIVILVLLPAPDPLAGVETVAVRVGDDAPSSAVDVESQLRIALGDRDITIVGDEASADMILQCMTNVHWGRIHVTGARLLNVLEHAGIAQGAWKVGLRGAEGFTTDLRIDEIQEQPDAFLLAYAMNDEPLTPDHGFPLRIAAEGKYGDKWCKWLTEIELVDQDVKGHYEGNRGWSDKATRGEPVE